MIRVGIIGCGKIADAHAEQIQRIRGCRIVGVCDREALMARQLYERFHVEQYFDNVKDLLAISKPNVVHITTPPQGHFDLGKTCLEAGCHVYIEKPFTVNTEEAEDLIRLATKNRLKVTVGHDDQFTHATRRMRELINDGYLGGAPVHMESYYCYDLGGADYAKALLADKKHWIRGLPGTLMQNTISHGICRIAEFISDDNPLVIADGFISPFLRGLGENQIVDEARVIIRSKDVSAYFTFSTQMRPALKHFRAYGRKNALIVDHDQQLVIKLKGAKYKSYLEKFVPPVDFALQMATNSFRNFHSFLRNDFHMKSGMKFLIESFYRSITDDTPLPISYREIVLTARIMESIFSQISRTKEHWDMQSIH